MNAGYHILFSEQAIIFSLFSEQAIIFCIHWMQAIIFCIHWMHIILLLSAGYHIMFTECRLSYFACIHILFTEQNMIACIQWTKYDSLHSVNKISYFVHWMQAIIASIQWTNMIAWMQAIKKIRYPAFTECRLS